MRIVQSLSQCSWCNTDQLCWPIPGQGFICAQCISPAPGGMERRSPKHRAPDLPSPPLLDRRPRHRAEETC